MTIKELADMIADILNVKKQEVRYADWTKGDIKIFNIDNSKIVNKLGIKFLTDLRKGLNFTIEWTKRHFLKGEGNI